MVLTWAPPRPAPRAHAPPPRAPAAPPMAPRWPPRVPREHPRAPAGPHGPRRWRGEAPKSIRVFVQKNMFAFLRRPAAAASVQPQSTASPRNASLESNLTMQPLRPASQHDPGATPSSAAPEHRFAPQCIT